MSFKEVGHQSSHENLSRLFTENKIQGTGDSQSRLSAISEHEASVLIKLNIKDPQKLKRYTQVSKEDADLAQYNWHYDPQGNYAKRTFLLEKKVVNQHMHRIILERIIGRELAESEVCDHIDNDGLNNKRDNLRLATHKDASHNRRKSRENTSGYTGVSYRKSSKKNGKLILLLMVSNIGLEILLILLMQPVPIMTQHQVILEILLDLTNYPQNQQICSQM